jgi:hypothetical protein
MFAILGVLHAIAKECALARFLNRWALSARSPVRFSIFEIVPIIFMLDREPHLILWPKLIKPDDAPGARAHEVPAIAVDGDVVDLWGAHAPRL